MTYLEAIQKIEDAMTALGVQDKWGEPCIGLECMGLVNKFCGTSWSENENALEFGRITLEQYTEAALSMLDEMNRMLYRMKLEKKLTFLRIDQIKMGTAV